MTDPLSDVLRTVRLTGGLFLDARFTAPWCVRSQLTAEDCRPFLESPGQLIAYHFVIEGTVHLGLDGAPPVAVRAGEIVLLPGNDPHTLSSAPGLVAVQADDLIQTSEQGGLARIAHGGDGPAAHLVCGFLGSEDAYNPLIEALPRVLTLNVREGASRDWIEASVRYAAEELVQGRFASSSIMSRLSELLFVEAVRAYAAAPEFERIGWLRGLGDPQIGKALALLHRDLRTGWTVEQLAREVAMSRSAFADRFTQLIGVSPIRYQSGWRLQASKRWLREAGRSIAQVAHEVGYESEAAFSRAFKREYGLSPSLWRDQALR